MLFAPPPPAEIKKLSPIYEAHRNYMLCQGTGEKMAPREEKILEKAGRDKEEFARVYDIGPEDRINQEAVQTLKKRAKALWRLAELDKWTLIEPDSSKFPTSCLFGGVIDHIF